MPHKLAIHGGTPVRTKPFPPRRQFAEPELEAVKQVFDEYWRIGKDFGYQGIFEERYTQAFAEFQGGGFVDAVATGSAAIYLCLAALQLPEKSKIIVSPVTDPGAIAAVFLLGYQPVVADSAPNCFNTGPDEFLQAIEPGVSAAIITHVAGIPTAVDQITNLAAARGIRIIEDCSHAHGATLNEINTGCFGDIAGFSTMFSKNHGSSGCGGLVFTRDERLYQNIRMYADRGKPYWEPHFDPKDPRQFLFPAINFNQDEISCAIGLSTLSKLPQTNRRRNEIISTIKNRLGDSKLFSFVEIPPKCTVAPFFLAVIVNTSVGKGVSKSEIARAVAAEGVPINPDYQYVVAEWPWVSAASGRQFKTPNATQHRESSFNILFHEAFRDEDASDIAEALRKVEHHYIS